MMDSLNTEIIEIINEILKKLKSIDNNIKSLTEISIKNEKEKTDRENAKIEYQKDYEKRRYHLEKINYSK